MGAPFLAQRVHLDGHVELRFVGELDLSAYDEAANEGLQALDESSGRLFIDVSELNFCDSSGIRAFIRIRDKATASGRELVLRRPHRNLHRVLQALALEEYFVIENDEGADE